MTGPPRPLVPDSLRADRGGGAPVRLPADAQARFDAARDRLRDARATRTADDLTVDDAPTPAAEIDAARARIDAARTRLSDRPRRRSAGRPPRT
ncbi:MAG: hypothetical protein M0P31_10115 [Solirubrobacteraceae bacterium]|nr:hypothetical protein [Solirubrobacteraceae bacterium]